MEQKIIIDFPETKEIIERLDAIMENRELKSFDYISSKRLAKRLDMSEQTLKSEHENGKYKKHIFGRKIFYRLSEVKKGFKIITAPNCN